MDLDFKGIVGINLYSLMILTVVYIFAMKNMDKESLQNKVYLWMLRMTFILLVVDVMGRFDGNPEGINLYLNHIGNFLLFIFNPILSALWLVYVHCNIYQAEEKAKKLFIPIGILFIINTSMVILSQFYGWFYYIDKANIYHRGDLYLLSALTSIALIIFSFYMIIRNRKSMEGGLYFPLMVFGIIPTIAIILQIFFYGLSLMISSVSISLLIAFINIQIKNMHTDFLTGVGNRKKLQSILEEKMASSSKEKTFSAIMIDLDDFKSINDKFGHDVGDNALKITAKLLNKSIRANDYVSRFGGDEFYIILDIYDEKKVKDLVGRIKDSFEHYNLTSDLPFKLIPSMGYAIYDYESQMTVEEFQKHVDNLLYENKKTRKAIK